MRKRPRPWPLEALAPGAPFQTARALVRVALRVDGIAARIDACVETLLGPPGRGIVGPVPARRPEPAEI